LIRFHLNIGKSTHLSDAPLKTIKTVIFTIVQIKRDTIYDNLNLIPNKEKSEIYLFIERAFKTLTAKENQADSAGVKISVNSSTSYHGNHESPSTKLHKQAQIELKDIFGKFGTLKTQEGLFDLYNFNIAHPDFDLNSHLKKSCTEYFYSFIMNGLEQIKVERERLQCGKSKQYSSNIALVSNVINMNETPRLTQRPFNDNHNSNTMANILQQNIFSVCGSTPEFPTGENLYFDNVKEWCIDFAESSGIDRNVFSQKIEKKFNEQMQMFTGDPDEDFETATGMAENFFENVRQCKEFLEK